MALEDFSAEDGCSISRYGSEQCCTKSTVSAQTSGKTEKVKL